MTVAETFTSLPGRGTNRQSRRAQRVSIADQSCNAGANGVVAVNALKCNNVEIGNDLVDVVGIGGNTN